MADSPVRVPFVDDPVEVPELRMLLADTTRQSPDDGIRFCRTSGWNEDEIDDFCTPIASLAR